MIESRWRRNIRKLPEWLSQDEEEIWENYLNDWVKMKKKYKKTTWMIESRWRRNIRKLPEWLSQDEEEI